MNTPTLVLSHLEFQTFLNDNKPLSIRQMAKSLEKNTGIDFHRFEYCIINDTGFHSDLRLPFLFKENYSGKIVCYGGTCVKPKRYKIERKGDIFTAFRRISGKFYPIGTGSTLTYTQALCYIG